MSWFKKKAPATTPAAFAKKDADRKAFKNQMAEAFNSSASREDWDKIAANIIDNNGGKVETLMAIIGSPFPADLSYFLNVEPELNKQVEGFNQRTGRKYHPNLHNL